MQFPVCGRCAARTSPTMLLGEVRARVYIAAENRRCEKLSHEC